MVKTYEELVGEYTEDERYKDALLICMDKNRRALAALMECTRDDEMRLAIETAKAILRDSI